MIRNPSVRRDFCIRLSVSFQYYGDLQFVAVIVFSENLLLSLRADFGINLSRCDTGVSENFLNRTQIGSVNQQIGGKSMAQILRGGVGIDARTQSIFLVDFFDTVRVQGEIVAVREQKVGTRQ